MLSSEGLQFLIKLETGSAQTDIRDIIDFRLKPKSAFYPILILAANGIFS
jgi:hypothetical protein